MFRSLVQEIARNMASWKTPPGLDPKDQEDFKKIFSHSRSLSDVVEAMRSRTAARLIARRFRALYPKVVVALIDERDQVRRKLRIGQRFGLQ